MLLLLLLSCSHGRLAWHCLWRGGMLDGEGELRDGQRVTVRFPFRFLLADILMVEVLAHARQWQVYAKGLGLLDPAIYGS